MPKKTFSDGSTYGTTELVATVAMSAIMVGAFFGVKHGVKNVIIPKIANRLGYHK